MDPGQLVRHQTQLLFQLASEGQGGGVHVHWEKHKHHECVRV